MRVLQGQPGVDVSLAADADVAEEFRGVGGDAGILFHGSGLTISDHELELLVHVSWHTAG